jgi:hypothetical protein
VSAPAVDPSASSRGLLSDSEQTTNVVVKITRIDLEAHTIAGLDPSKTELVFFYLPKTQVRKLTPYETTRLLEQILLTGPFPLHKDQEVLVSWKLDATKRKRLAAKLTIY